ncbi:sulfotransferase [Dasania marina]|uniref:sulfotransferase n=1 Tax=Dasania marina TaxID=471499 RepID=UPI0030DAB9E9|tara:strand:+ start:41216 stop:41869 length:654 start_codon:yes stop_codon:yes gene_type:complete
MKIFIIGLPRTGTTSLCATLLALGYSVAHTAFTQAAIEQAVVVADTPAYCDYPFLDQRYPGSKFIYLERDLTLWLPSIQQLLNRMIKNIRNDSGGFNPVLKRCFKQVFAPFEQDQINSQQHLSHCYQQHQQQLVNYFRGRPQDLLNLNLADSAAPQQLLAFLGLTANPKLHFPQLNQGQKITAWNKIDHPLKVPANLSGKNGRKYFDMRAVARSGKL